MKGINNQELCPFTYKPDKCAEKCASRGFCEVIGALQQENEELKERVNWHSRKCMEYLKLLEDAGKALDEALYWAKPQFSECIKNNMQTIDEALGG